MPKSPKPLLRSLGALALVLTLIAAGCTSGDDRSATTTSSAEPEATDPPDDEEGTTTSSTTEAPTVDDDDAPLEASDTGVTDTQIKIAYLGFDTQTLVDLGLISATADTPVVARAIVDDLNSRGGIHGRTIELVPEIWNPLAPDLNAELQRACLAVTEDEEVFAAVAVSFFGDAVTCLAGDHNTPLLAQGTLPGFLVDAEPRNVFLLNLEERRVVSATVEVLADQGHLDGITSIGAFGDDEPGRRELAEETLADALDAAGHSLDGVGLVPPAIGGSGAETAAIVTRFKEDDIDGVFMLGNILSDAAFMVEADKQGYNPTYLLSDFGDGTRDLIGTRAPESQLVGSVGTTWRRTGQAAAGQLPSDYDNSCFDRFGGDVILDEGGEEGVFAAVTEQCVSFDVLEAALLAAGRNPTRESFVAALETLGEIEFGTGAAASFSPDKHDAVDSVKVVEWQADCACWFPISDFEPARSR